MSEEEKRETLNRFYNDLYADKICFKLSSQEVSDIRGAVIDLVERIADKLGHIDEKFRIRDVILVGSAREETQITLPGEYDFLLVLDGLSQQGVIEINMVCLDKENCAHVKVKDDRLKRQFKDLLKGDELLCTRDDSLFSWKDGLREEFRHVMEKAIRANVNEKICYSTGILRLDNKSVKVHGPAFNPQFEWHGCNGKVIDISVDLCPVIRLAGEFPEFINLDNVVCETYYNYAQVMGAVMLLPCKKGHSCRNGLCFSVIFTETEMVLMKDLSEHHRKCYMLLKYLLNAKQRPSLGKAFDWADNLIEPETTFFSYILKILVLDHHYIQKCTETKCFASCLERILHKIINITHFARIVIPGIPPRNWLSNPFFKNQNVWSSHGLKLADQDLTMKLRFLLIELEVIGDMKEYTYDHCFIYTVRGNMFARPLAVAIIIAVFSVYICPALGHLLENICRFLIWKHVELGKIMWHLMDPIDCRNDNCCMPIEQRKELMKQTDSGITIDGIYFMAAVEISVFAVYIYPDCGHLIGDMCRFLSRKFTDLWKQA